MLLGINVGQLSRYLDDGSSLESGAYLTKVPSRQVALASGVVYATNGAAIPVRARVHLGGRQSNQPFKELVPSHLVSFAKWGGRLPLPAKYRSPHATWPGKLRPYERVLAARNVSNRSGTRETRRALYASYTGHSILRLTGCCHAEGRKGRVVG